MRHTLGVVVFVVANGDEMLRTEPEVRLDVNNGRPHMAVDEDASARTASPSTMSKMNRKVLRAVVKLVRAHLVHGYDTMPRNTRVAVQKYPTTTTRIIVPNGEVTMRASGIMG